jgi:hypothetical protein
MASGNKAAFAACQGHLRTAFIFKEMVSQL